jgi:hypothetical protein
MPDRHNHRSDSTDKRRKEGGDNNTDRGPRGPKSPKSGKQTEAADTELQALAKNAKEARQDLDALAADRDAEKPKSQRVRELRGKYKETQHKLDNNVGRLKKQTSQVEWFRSGLGKVERQQQELERIIEAQSQKVKLLHTELGSITDDSGSESGDESSDHGLKDDAMGRQASPGKVWGTVGRHGRVQLSTDEERLASLMKVKAGSGAAHVLRREGGGGNQWGDEPSASEGDTERRSRSSPR